MSAVDFLQQNWAVITGVVGLVIFVASVVIKNFFPKEEAEFEKVVDTTTQTLSATGTLVAEVETLKKVPKL